MIDTLVTLFSEMLIGVFGSYFIIGGFVLFIFIIIGLAMRLTPDVWLVILAPLVWLLAEANFLPSFMEYISYFFLAIIVALGLYRLVQRR